MSDNNSTSMSGLRNYKS